MTKIIIETDLGHDADDFYAILYLAEIGYEIAAITISPGDPDQIAVAELIRGELGYDFPIGVSKLDRTKYSSWGMYHTMLDRYGYSKDGKHDGYGPDIIKKIFETDPATESLVIGPVSSLGRYLEANPTKSFSNITMQGGYCSYDQHSFPCQKLEKFTGCPTVSTFNLNGDIKGGLALSNALCSNKRFVGKNVCHTVEYTKDIAAKLQVNSRPTELFKEASDILMEHNETKKFHDPTAAVCHVHPEIGSWITGQIYRESGKWGTRLNGGNQDLILADINYDKLWEHLTNFN
jgi:inosine-uridine nucleoside N-ribohydrolase